MKNPIEILENFLKEHNISNKKVIVGFSAGPDSTCLALLLNELKEKYNLEIILAYFNHNWRDEAILEEDFTNAFAKKINATVCIKKAPKNVKKSEEKARELRYNFFEKCAQKYKTDVVFLAHNKNDNIETILYRFIKGTSIKGLSAIPKIRGIYHRPFLNILKKDILETLKKYNQNYMIDLSNDDIKYKRNLIRKEIFPLFEKINPNYLENINILIENAINSNKIIDDAIFKIKNEIIIKDEILYDKFIMLDISYRLAILNDFLGDKLKYRDNKTLKKLDDLILKNNSRSSINANICLAIKKNKIFLEKKTIVKNKTPHGKIIERIKWTKM